MHSLPRHITIIAALGGALWTVKALGITVNDGSFDPLENVFFLGGLFSLLLASVLIAVHVGRRLGGLRGAAAGAATAVGLVAGTLAIEAVGHALVGGIASGSNVGLEEEGGILLAGLAWLALAAAARTRRAPRAAMA